MVDIRSVAAARRVSGVRVRRCVDEDDDRGLPRGDAHFERAVDLAATSRETEDLDGPVAGDVLAAGDGAVGEFDRAFEVVSVDDVAGVERLDRHAVVVADRVEALDEVVDVVDGHDAHEQFHQKSPRLDWSSPSA